MVFYEKLVINFSNFLLMQKKNTYTLTSYYGLENVIWKTEKIKQGVSTWNRLLIIINIWSI